MNCKISLLITLTILNICFADKLDNNTFIATTEWREIHEGQKVPAGLHVRINLKTGKKEAKILDESAEESSASDTETLAGNSHGSSNAALLNLEKSNEETEPEDATKLKEKGANLANVIDDIIKDRLAIKYSPEKLEKIKREYKSYEEIKKSYNEMRKSFKTDTELIIGFIEQYNNLSKSDGETVELSQKNKIVTELQILDNFGYLVHQIDNALIFIENGGLDQVLLPIIVNQTHVGLRVEAMRVLGALTQNNPKAQIKVFQRNFGSHLSQILVSSTNTEELSVAIYAFGSLLRKFPHAQLRILSTYGTHALITILSKECELKIKAKAVTLISDLTVEKQFVLSESSVSENPLAAAQYAEINFNDWLRANSYCETMDTLITSKFYEFLDEPDVAEYFVVALQNTHTLCESLWSQSPQLRHTLLTLKNRYTQSKVEYQIDIAAQIETLLNSLYASNNVARDEL